MDNEFWKEMRDVAYGTARKRGATHAHADDLAQKAVMILAARMEREEVRNPAGFVYRTVCVLTLRRDEGRPQWEDLMDDVTPLLRDELASSNVGTCAVQWMLNAAALLKVLHFGWQHGHGRLRLLLASSEIDPSSVEMAFEYIERLIRTAPADPHTRRNAREIFQHLFTWALESVEIDTEKVVTEEMQEMGRGWVERDGARRQLSGNAQDGVTLLRLLFSRMPEPVAMAHAMKVEEQTWAGRDRGSSIWAFEVVDLSPEGESVREVEEDLAHLWKWQHGGELTLSMGHNAEVTVSLLAEDKHLLIEAPTGEQCFGQPLPADTVEVLVKEFGFDPPDEEFDTYTMELEIKKKDRNADVVSFVFELLEEVYGRDPEDPFAWEVEYFVPEPEEEAA